MAFEELMRRVAGSSALAEHEVNEFVRTMSDFQATLSRVNQLCDPDNGNLNANIFHGTHFGQLPHEAGSLYMPASSQAITSAFVSVTNGWDTIANHGATWSKGLVVDSTLGRIYVNGIARETVILVQMSGYFSGSSVYPGNGATHMQYHANDGSVRPIVVPSLGLGSSWYSRSAFLTHVRSLPAGQTYYDLQVINSSQLPASSFSGGLFTITRLR